MDMERFDFGWRRESGLNVRQGLKGTDHEARAHEQNKSQTYLDDDKNVTRSMPLPAGADRAACFAQPCPRAATGVPESRHCAEQET
jgi:hypothetical protein